MLYRIDLTTNTIQPDDAPWAHVVQSVLPQETWLDLTERGYPGIGYWPAEDRSTAYDNTTQYLGNLVLTVDTINKRVIRTKEVIALSAEQIEQSYVNQVQGHLDGVAQAHGYDNILSACSYAGAPNTFQTEGAKFITWRGAVWDACHAVMAQVQAGTLPQPTIAGLLTMLPALPN